MKRVGLVFSIVFVFSCGASNNTKNEQAINNDSNAVKAAVKDNKSHLKKRPEEFKEFFILSNVVAFKGKVATQKDVTDGKAVFNLKSNGDPSHKVIDCRIPFFAFLTQPTNQPLKFVAVMQSEELKGDTILGYKAANGLFGICKPNELEFFEAQKNSIFNKNE